MNNRPSLTPAQDYVETGIAKMREELELCRGKDTPEHVVIKELGQDVFAVIARFVAKGVDENRKPEFLANAVMHAIGWNAVSNIATATNVDAIDEDFADRLTQHFYRVVHNAVRTKGGFYKQELQVGPEGNG